MTEPKKTGKKATSAKAKHSARNTTESGAKGAGWILFALPIVISSIIYVYLYPAALRQFVDSWIGFSERYDTSPNVAQPLKEHLYADIERRNAVVDAFKFSWGAYERDAFGDDEYHPISQKGSNLTSAGGIGYMIIDVLDTMQIMGLDEEYNRARSWVDQKLSFDVDAYVSLFETTIRVLGGLLSAYHLSGNDQLYLDKATDLAERMLPAFQTATGLPLPEVNLKNRVGRYAQDHPGLNSVAEVGTLQVEFKYLAQLTDNDEYWRTVEKVMEIIRKGRPGSGLVSIFMMIDSGRFYPSDIRLGSRADSYYEYLLKQYLQTNGSEPVYREMYADAMDSIHQYLVRQSPANKMLYTAELIPEYGQGDWRLSPKQDHLVCFLGGSLMLGATRTGALVDKVSVPPQPGQLSEIGLRDWETGRELVKTCLHTHDTATGLSPEIAHFRIPNDGLDDMPHIASDWYIKGSSPDKPPPYDSRYMLRPETVESLFIAYRLTGDELYRERGWKIFQSIEKHCKVETGGYATVLNVDQVPAVLEDKMETFFLSETLKYLYLLFDDSDTIPLDKYVFNTEAHPLPIFNPTSFRTGFS